MKKDIRTSSKVMAALFCETKPTFEQPQAPDELMRQSDETRRFRNSEKPTSDG